MSTTATAPVSPIGASRARYVEAGPVGSAALGDTYARDIKLRRRLRQRRLIEYAGENLFGRVTSPKADLSVPNPALAKI